MPRYFLIISFLVLPFFLIWFVYYVEFIPSWYWVQTLCAILISLLYLLVGFKLAINLKKSNSSKKRKIAFYILISLIALLVFCINSYKIIRGPDSYMMTYRRLKYEFHYEKPKKTSIYVFNRAEMLENDVLIYVKQAGLPFMHNIYEIKSGWLDSCSSKDSKVLFYGHESFPWMKPILMTYDLNSDDFTVVEDTTRNRGLSAPPRK